MLVIGSVQTAYPVRSAAVEAKPTAQPVPAMPTIAPAGTSAVADDRPAHFTMISTISPGSLAAAYHTMRASDSPSGAASSATPAILSGQGVPSALSAYGEVLDID